MRTAIIGASGYSGEELVRLVSGHPSLEITALTSRSLAGRRAGEVMPGLQGKARDLVFEPLAPEEVAPRGDVFLLALPHGVAAEYAVPLRAQGKLVVDLSADFRLRSAAVYQEFYGSEHPAPELLAEAVYGLPELHRGELGKAGLIACPGCYPTSILLALAPALRAGLIETETIVIDSLSGVSGAGKKAEVALLFAEINENMKAYGAPKHRHLGEIEQELAALAGKPVTVSFTPHLIPITRGMLTTVTAKLARETTAAEVNETYRRFFVDEPFVEVKMDGSFPEVREVVRSNRAVVTARIDVRTRRLLLNSAIDNLGKGAAGQAVQALNARLGLAETAGLLG